MFPRFFTARVRSTTEGYSFTLLVCSRGGGGSGPAGGVRSKVNPARGGGGVRSKVNQPGGGGGGGSVRSKVNPVGGVRSKVNPAWGVGVVVVRSKVNPAGGQQVKGQSSWPGGGGQIQPGGSASCALLRAVCLLRSRRRTFLFHLNKPWRDHVTVEKLYLIS